MNSNFKGLKGFFLLVLFVSVLIVSNCYAKTPAEEAFQKGASYSQQGKYNEAIAQFTKAIQIKPTSAAYSYRAYVYLLQNKTAPALSDCNKALEIDPKNSQAYNNRAAAYQRKGDFDQAILDCNKAIEINPNNPYPYKNRAVAYFAKKEYDKSWDDVHKAESLAYNFDINFIQKVRKASGRKE